MLPSPMRHQPADYKYFARILLIFVLALGGGVCRSAAQQAVPEQAPAPHSNAQQSAATNATPLVVMISVDGIKPEYVTQADAHGAKVPNLRKFMKEGTFAEGVQGVVP